MHNLQDKITQNHQKRLYGFDKDKNQSKANQDHDPFYHLSYIHVKHDNTPCSCSCCAVSHQRKHTLCNVAKQPTQCHAFSSVSRSQLFKSKTCANKYQQHPYLTKLQALHTGLLMTLGGLTHNILKNKGKNRKILYYKNFLENLQDFIMIFSSVKSNVIIDFYDKYHALHRLSNKILLLVNAGINVIDSRLPHPHKICAI